jgi:membrane protein DedA with SNARE-associated domain
MFLAKNSLPHNTHGQLAFNLRSADAPMRPQLAYPAGGERRKKVANGKGGIPGAKVPGTQHAREETQFAIRRQECRRSQEETMSQMTQFLISHGGLFLFVIVFADQCGLPFPAVPWLLAAGALAAGGKLSLLGAICWASLGSLGADMVWFHLGQREKTRIFRVFPHWEARKHTLPRKLHTRLILRGVRVLTAAKFLPFGTVVPLRAGALEVGSLRFFLIDAFSSVVYAAAYVVSGFTFHSQLEQVVAFVRKLGVIALLLLVAAVGAYLGCVFCKRASKRTHHLNQSRFPSPIDGAESESKESRIAGTPALSQTIK